jgi:hypothetical protein
MTQQTAVAWLEGEFLKLEQTTGVHGVMYELIEKAKEMEKQQKIEDYRSGRVDQQSGSSSNAYNRTAEQYYTETYGK